MLEALRRWRWKRGQLRKLAGEAYLKEAMAIYDGETIKDLEALRAHDLADKAKCEAEIVALATATDYESGRRKRDLEKEIEKINIKIEGRQRSIGQMTAARLELESQAAEILERRRVFKDKF